MYLTKLSINNNFFLQVSEINFADTSHLTNLLENLVNTFKEFKAHEHIENKYIMKKLKEKLKTLSIRSTALCNCHSDNRLTDMLELVYTVLYDKNLLIDLIAALKHHCCK